MNVFITSDTHFRHNNIIKYCNRPFKNVDEMNNSLIKNWNSVVSNEDVVFHLGDFGFGSKDQLSPIIKSLNGTIVMLHGNHKSLSTAQWNSFGVKVCNDPIKLSNDIYLSHRPMNLLNNNMWNIHGHIHQEVLKGNYINVSVEQTNYSPILLYNLIIENILGISIEDFSYMYGFLISDGYWRDNNKTLEMEIKDKDLPIKFQKLLPQTTIRERCRDTNFKKNNTTYIWKGKRNGIFEYLCSSMGFPIEDKSKNASIPKNFQFSERDFWRGVFDANGSIGTRKDGSEYMSLTIVSEQEKIEFCQLLEKVIGFKSKAKRNKRDNIYNIGVNTNSARKLGDYLYKNATLYLDRKYNKYREWRDKYERRTS